jgi:hypothetical protein
LSCVRECCCAWSEQGSAGIVPRSGVAAVLLVAACGASHSVKSGVKSKSALRPLTASERRALEPFVAATEADCATFRRWYTRRSSGLYISGTARQKRAEYVKWNALFAEAMSREKRLIEAVGRAQPPEFAKQRVRAFTRALRGNLYVLTVEQRITREGRDDAIASDQMLKMLQSANRWLDRTASILGLKSCQRL